MNRSSEKNGEGFKWRWFLIVLAASAMIALFFYQFRHFKIETDIVASLPQNDPVLSDARYCLTNLALRDRVAVDLSLNNPDRDLLVEGALFIQERLKKSGLFQDVGIEQMQEIFPELMGHIINTLPAMFTAAELDESVKPLLSPNRIRSILSDDLAQLQSLEGIGLAEFARHDPLGLRNLVMARLSGLAPSENASVYRGQLISSNSRHVLILAEMLSSGTDTKVARQIDSLLKQTSSDLKSHFAERGAHYILNPVGAYRAALDNETMTKRDTQKAVLLSTILVAFLLIMGFPRPLLGLLALLPSVAGTMMAFIVYSMIHDTITILATGFGGAILSFTVDYGITYLLFLDRPYKTYGRKATRESWSLGLLAMLTTAVSFAFLFVSGFPALAQIGEFAALGVLFTYLCVHAVFPLVFPTLPPARRKGFLPLQRIVSRVISSKGKWKFYVVAALGTFMLFFAKPEFHVDLNSMSSVSRDTLLSEKLVKETWGDLFNRIYLLVEAKDPGEILNKGDRLLPTLQEDIRTGVLSSGFLPSMIFPGTQRANENFEAWRTFWNGERIAQFKRNLTAISMDLGFRADAFEPFLRMIEERDFKQAGIPDRFYSMMGLSKKHDQSGWIQFSMLTPGPSYNGDSFYSKYARMGLAKVFDPEFFSRSLGEVLMSGFVKMALIVGLVTVIVALLYLFDIQLVFISILPTVFALICTLGTLRVLGQPLGIPAIMVSVVVIGMGSDYALYLVRSHQRYMDETNASLGLVRMSVFLSFATTFAGFGVLALSTHSLLKSAGLCLALGIGYSFLGAVMIVPPALKKIYAPAKDTVQPLEPGAKEHFRRALQRYKHMEAYPRLFARFKIQCDPMFPRLAEFVKPGWKIIDVGCGYGVPAAWLLTLYPDLEFTSCDPAPERARVAARVLGEKAMVMNAGALDLPLDHAKADAVLLLDVLHYLQDEEMVDLLIRLRASLSPQGRLIIRITLPGPFFSIFRFVEESRLRMKGAQPYWRRKEKVLEILGSAGFRVELVEPTAQGREETWFIGVIGEEPVRRDSGSWRC
jgi:predicted exporter/SAM-dependent methyltransferase